MGTRKTLKGCRFEVYLDEETYNDLIEYTDLINAVKKETDAPKPLSANKCTRYILRDFFSERDKNVKERLKHVK